MTATLKLGYGEQVAPPQVDTLRDEQCPVCGESTAFTGDECAVCGFESPPDAFMDPDLDKAKEMNLRQDQNDDTTDQAQPGPGLACDNCGATFGGKGPAKTNDPAKPGAPAGPAATGLPTQGIEQYKVAALPEPDKTAPVTPGQDEQQNPLPTTEHQAGDQCPECGEGTLQPSADPVAAAPSAPEDVKQETPAPGEGDPKSEDDSDPDSEDDEPDDDEDDDKPDFLKKKKDQKPAKEASNGQKESTMRPTLKALAEQQAMIQAQGEALDAIAEAAGLDLTAIKRKAGRKIAQIRRYAADDDAKAEDEESTDSDDSGSGSVPPEFLEQQKKSRRVQGDGKKSAPPDGHEHYQPLLQQREDQGQNPDTGLPLYGKEYDDWVARNPGKKPVASRRTADADNPMQPVPEPAAEAPVVTTEEVINAIPSVDVTAPGGGAPTEGVQPDAKTDVTTPSTVLDEPLDLNELDVTAPVAGTQEGDPEKMKIDTDVRVGDPNKQETMYPLDGGPFAAKASAGRAFASMRLARLRIQAGIAPDQDDMVLGQAIASTDLSDRDMQSEIRTLASVIERQPAQKPVARNLVPQPRTAGRNTPSMAAPVVIPTTEGSLSPSDAEVNGLW